MPASKHLQGDPHVIRTVLTGLLLSIAALPALARDISGSVSYLARIALDPQAELVVELRGPGGLVAELREETGGRQVPLPFTLATEDSSALTLRAAIFEGGLPTWVSAAVAVEGGEQAVDLGDLQLDRHVAMGFSTRMRCGETTVEVGFAGAGAQLRAGGVVHDLTAVETASGAKYSDGASPETSFWSKGNRALVTLAGKDLTECLPEPVASLLPLVARGNEPGWMLTAGAEGVVLSMQDGGEVRATLPAPKPEADGLRFTTAEFSFLVTPAICRDTMTGMPHPQTVALTAGAQQLVGCGGAPQALLDGSWRAETLNGTPLPPDAEVTLDIAGDSLSGKSACNRYFSGVTLSGEGLSLGQGGGTMMACPDPLMAVEQAFLAMLGQVTRFDIDDSGALVLLAGDTAVLTARR
jgi:heat shock protein HslJ/membrane-bound inhibitor of C-type lysozyme